MEKDEQLLIKLRDCFTAGYTLPQYCIDNGIKKPLFVSEKKFELFVWEVYIQFHYDKRLSAQFSFTDDDKTDIYFPAHPGIISNINVKNFSAMNLNAFDKIIFLTTKKSVINNQTIYLDVLTNYFIQKVYCEIPLLKFSHRHPKVKLFLTHYPSVWRYKGSNEFNSALYNVGEFTARLRKDKSGNLETTLDRFGYTNAQALEIASAPQVKRNPDGTTIMIDDDTKLLQRIKNGKRATAYQPEHFQNKIYFFGQCIYYGIYAPFDKTLESYLQKMLNENNLPYRVENESQCCYGRTQDILYNLNACDPAPDDIVFVVMEGLHTNNDVIPFVNIADVFDPPHDYREFYCVRGHVNELGYKLMAEKFFKFLTENNFFREKIFNYPLPPPISSLRYPAAI